MNRINDIYILTNTLLKGGAEKQSVLLAAVMGNKATVTLVSYYGELADPSLLALVEFYRINLIRLEGSHFRKCRYLISIFRANKNAIVFSYLATTNLLSAIFGKLTGVKFLIGGIRSDEIPKTKLIVQRFLHNHLLTYTIFNNYSGRNALIKSGFSRKKCKVIHNCIDLKMERFVRQINRQNINIVTIGRFVNEKDWYTAILSVKKLAEKITQAGLNIDVSYFLIGYGKLESDIRRWVSDTQLSKIIEIIINPPEIDKYLKQGDIYLSTSLREGLSNSIMEAMEYCLPIVATNVGDNCFLVEHGFNGFLTNTKDVGDISEKLFTLVGDPSLIGEMGKNSYEKLKNGFTMEIFRRNYLNLIDECKSY